MRITENDVGRIAIRRDGQRVQITDFIGNQNTYPVWITHMDDPKIRYSIAVTGVYWPGNEGNKDIIQWEDEDRSIMIIAHKMYVDYIRSRDPNFKTVSFENFKSLLDNISYNMFYQAAKTAYNAGMKVPPAPAPDPVELFTQELFSVIAPDGNYKNSKELKTAYYESARKIAEYLHNKNQT